MFFTDSFIVLVSQECYCSAEIVFSTFLFEKIKFLEGLQSVNSEVKVRVWSHTKGVSSVLNLDVVEDHSGDVVGVLLGEGLIGGGFNLGDKFVSII